MSNFYINGKMVFNFDELEDRVEALENNQCIGVPTLWIGEKPDWAIDFGNGATNQYLWSNYPKLNNDNFKSILTTLSNNGWCSAYNSSGFYVPDLRGIVPIGYGTNALKSGCGGGNLGAFSESQNKWHSHTIAHTHGRGNMDITGYFHLRYNASAYDAHGLDTGRSGCFVTKTRSNSGEANIETSSGSGQGVDYNFKASSGWTGSTSQPSASSSGSTGGTQAKPATIGCMWIVRYE